MWEGGGGQDGVEWGGKWDNCNTIINKYIFFKGHMDKIEGWGGGGGGRWGQLGRGRGKGRQGIQL